jgi:hypothetical protein
MENPIKLEIDQSDYDRLDVKHDEEFKYNLQFAKQAKHYTYQALHHVFHLTMTECTYFISRFLQKNKKCEADILQEIFDLCEKINRKDTKSDVIKLDDEYLKNGCILMKKILFLDENETDEKVKEVYLYLNELLYEHYMNLYSRSKIKKVANEVCVELFKNKIVDGKLEEKNIDYEVIELDETQHI